MPMSCKCILDRMVHKGAMTEKERDKILRNLRMSADLSLDFAERLQEQCIYMNTNNLDYGCESCIFKLKTKCALNNPNSWELYEVEAKDERI